MIKLATISKDRDKTSFLSIYLFVDLFSIDFMLKDKLEQMIWILNQ